MSSVYASRLDAIRNKYKISLSQCHSIRRGMVKDMQIGLRTNGRDSSCKMLPSQVKHLPNGTEKGVFYAIDWGGSNVRFIRVKLSKNSKPDINFIKKKNPKRFTDH
eukprot:867057_1